MARSEPFVISFRGDLDSEMRLKLELEFMGYYGEPNLEIVHEVNADSDIKALHCLEYDPYIGEWKASRQ